MFLEHEGLVTLDARSARSCLQYGPLMVDMGAVDAIVKHEVHASPPEANIEVVIIVPVAVHETLVKAPYLFDGPGWHTGNEPQGPGHLGGH